MNLAKWQGLGNDYLIVEAAALPGSLTNEVIGLLCDRHLGVGSDGIILHERPSGAVPGAVARMRIFNPDGSEPEMCGNGIRMFARYLARSGAVRDSEFVVETLAGPIKPRLLADGRVRVDMGRARFESDNIDMAAVRAGTYGEAPAAGAGTGGGAVNAVLEAAGRRFEFTFVDVGNPHCVIPVDDPAGFDVAGVGPIIERHALFPNRVNVEFVHPEPDGSVRMRVWERGVGETQACGTGATAVGAAAVRLGWTAGPVAVHLPGGDLTIEVGEAEEHDADVTGLRVFMTGPAEEIFSCSLSPDLLDRLGWTAATDN